MESSKLFDLTGYSPFASNRAHFTPGFPVGQGRIEMRLFAVLVAICALSQTAAAQTPDCKGIADSTARLACYDKSVPTTAAAKPTAVVPAAKKDAAAKIDTAKYVDTISAEDALMNAKLKNICRGC
jgi:hypothetical protein